RRHAGARPARAVAHGAARQGELVGPETAPAPARAPRPARGRRAAADGGGQWQPGVSAGAQAALTILLSVEPADQARGAPFPLCSAVGVQRGDEVEAGHYARGDEQSVTGQRLAEGSLRCESKVS